MTSPPMGSWAGGEFIPGGLRFKLATLTYLNLPWSAAEWTSAMESLKRGQASRRALVSNAR